ncbi:Os09g0295300, partial [Oryza sativa Japonica Group]
SFLMAVVAAAEDLVPLLLSTSDMSRSATSPSSSSTSALLLSHQLWYRGKLASWDSLAVEHKRRASRSATSPACSSTTQCLSLICKSRSVIWSLGTSRYLSLILIFFCGFALNLFFWYSITMIFCSLTTLQNYFIA